MKTNEENSYTRRSPRVDGLLWLLCIGCLFCICIICVSLVSSDNSEFAASSEPYQYARSFEPAPLVSAIAAEMRYRSGKMYSEPLYSDNARDVSDAARTVKSATDDAASDKEVKASSDGVVQKAASVSPVSSDDRIEREAREVISGHYGNDPSRRAALGADYAAVQARVNELLR